MRELIRKAIKYGFASNSKFSSYLSESNFNYFNKKHQEEITAIRKKDFEAGEARTEYNHHGDAVDFHPDFEQYIKENK